MIRKCNIFRKPRTGFASRASSGTIVSIFILHYLYYILNQNNICIFVINQWLYTIITLSSGPNRTRGRAIRGCSNKKVEKALGGLLDETGGCFKDITGKGFLFSIIRNGN